MKWKLSVICLTLSALACGMPVTAAMIYPSVGSAPVPVNMDTVINTPMSTGVNMVVCNSGGWLNIRPEAGDLSISNGELAEGESVTVRMPYTVTEEMGLWGELVDGRGWINVGYLCEEK